MHLFKCRSFGVLLYEIVTRGAVPYVSMANNALVQQRVRRAHLWVKRFRNWRWAMGGKPCSVFSLIYFFFSLSLFFSLSFFLLFSLSFYSLSLCTSNSYCSPHLHPASIRWRRGIGYHDPLDAHRQCSALLLNVNLLLLIVPVQIVSSKYVEWNKVRECKRCTYGTCFILVAMPCCILNTKTLHSPFSCGSL